MAASWWKSEGAKNLSDACAGERAVFGEDDDASFAGDVAFH